MCFTKCFLSHISADQVNAATVTQCGGIPLIIQCLSSPVRNTVSAIICGQVFIPLTKSVCLLAIKLQMKAYN